MILARKKLSYCILGYNTFFGFLGGLGGPCVESNGS